jgi:hypothetical protein
MPTMCLSALGTGFYQSLDTRHWSPHLPLDSLKQQVENCTHMAQKEFSSAEKQNIVKYLNDQFYRFQ